MIVYIVSQLQSRKQWKFQMYVKGKLLVIPLNISRTTSNYRQPYINTYIYVGATSSRIWSKLGLEETPTILTQSHVSLIPLINTHAIYITKWIEEQGHVVQACPALSILNIILMFDTQINSIFIPYNPIEHLTIDLIFLNC